MTGNWSDISEEDILQANLDKYSQEHIIDFYRDYEEPQYLYEEYDVLFNAVINELKSTRGAQFKALDLCGGTGKGAFVVKRHAPKAQVSLVDLAPPMLDIAMEQAQKEGIDDLRIIAEDAFTFLERKELFDLIILSSAIHHFKDPVELITKAAKRLEIGGLIITIADPTTLIKSRRYKFMEFLAVDKVQKQARVKARFSPRPEDNFDIAEYQTITGIDDHALLSELKDYNIDALIHIRYPAGESKLTRLMIAMRLFWAFATVLRRRSSVDEAGMRWRIHAELQRGLAFPYQSFTPLVKSR